MFKAVSVFTLVLSVFLMLTIFSSSTNESKSLSVNSSTLTNEQLPQIIRSVDLNKSFSFAGEELPLDNFDVRERLDRELLRNAYWHSNTILNIKKATRFFPTIERILAEHGIPDDFKYLAVAESDLTNAISPAGAKGVWQFMKAVGQSYGLEINSEVDERFHLEKATHAACQLIQKQKDRFGSWTLAAAAYNLGGNRLSKDMKLQKMDNYYDLNLNQETSRYIFRIVAIKTIIQNPTAFGFQINAFEKYPPYPPSINIRIEKPIANLGDFAREQGTTYRMLKIYNPWLRSHSLSNKKRKSYLIKVPKN